MDREGGRVRRGGPESLEYDYCDLMMLIPYIPGVTETCKYRHMTHRSIGKRYRNINIWPVLKIEKHFEHIQDSFDNCVSQFPS